MFSLLGTLNKDQEKLKKVLDNLKNPNRTIICLIKNTENAKWNYNNGIVNVNTDESEQIFD